MVVLSGVNFQVGGFKNEIKFSRGTTYRGGEETTSGEGGRPSGSRASEVGPRDREERETGSGAARQGGEVAATDGGL